MGRVTRTIGGRTSTTHTVQELRASLCGCGGGGGVVTIKDHAKLKNLGFEESGHERFAGIEFGTTAEWNARSDYRPALGMLVVYTDYRIEEDEQGNITYIPGFKLGDGNAYLIDKPFLGEDVREALQAHLDDLVVHITQEERETWNDKLNYKDPGNSDLLEFTRD